MLITNEARILDLERRRELARADHAARTAELADRFDDTALQEEITQIEGEIQEIDKQISRLQIAKAEIDRRATTAAKQAEFAQLQADRDIVAANLVRMKELAVSIAALFDDNLPPPLTEFGARGGDARAGTWTILRRALGVKQAERVFGGCADLAQGLAAKGAIVDAIFASGLGRVGLNLDPFVSVSAVRAQTPLVDAMESAQAKLLAVLDAAIAQRGEELGVLTGKAKKRKSPGTIEQRFVSDGAVGGSVGA